MSDDLLKEFKAPTNAWRGKPFWSWNGKLDRDELMRQINVIERMGFGGFFMHSRTGLATEYLGEEWLDLTNMCADEAERRGMEAWLYDEDRWPSGTCGGQVTEDPAFRQKYMRLELLAAGDYAPVENELALFTAKVDGLAFSDAQPWNGKDEVEAGRTVLRFSWEEMEKRSFYNGNTYLDTLKKAATEKFIEMTHEKYKAACGKRLGTSIKGIFTDEPHRGQLMDGFSLDVEYRQWMAPWTESLFDDFEERFGYDLKARLPEVFLQPEGKAVSPVKWHYVELLQQLFLENWAKPCDDWCRENNFILTGHILHEDNLTAQTAMSGSMMRYYETMEWPGIDLLSEENYNFWVAKQLQSAARQIGQKWLLSELYGCTGWQMPFLGHKAVGDWQALFGINVRCHHLSWVSMEGESKRDFPASIFHHSSWWKEYDEVEAYFARFGRMMSQGEPVCDTLVVNPVESVWCQIYPGWSFYLGPQGDAVKKLEEQYADIFHWLQGAQIDFDYGDEEMMSRLASIEQSPEGPVLVVGKARYRQVVAGGMTTMRSTTLKLLEDFAAAGGKVIFAGDAPAYLDAVASDAPATFAAKATQVSFEFKALTDACTEALTQPVQVIDKANGEYAQEIYVQTRRDGDDEIIMALNVHRKDAFETRVRIAGTGVVEEWDCLSGERCIIPAEAKDGWLEFDVKFWPADEHLYVVRPARQDELPVKQETEVVGTQALEGPFEYRLAEPNVCVIDNAEWKMDDDDWQPQLDILKIDQRLRDRVGLPHRGGEMLQPWFVGRKEIDIKGRVSLRYRFDIDVMPRGAVDLAMERPEMHKIAVNGIEIDPITKSGWWVDKIFERLPIPAEALKRGKNTIEISLDLHESANLEAIYLLGDFGVAVEGSRSSLIKLPETLKPSCLTEQGLPFYSGPVTYHLTLPKGEADAYLTLPGMDAACAKVAAPGADGRAINWHPYEARVDDLAAEDGTLDLHVYLTRRNSFGPLHQIPLHTFNYGPGNFITEGEHWTDNYQLITSGLLSAPVVEWRKNK